MNAVGAIAQDESHFGGDGNLKEVQLIHVGCELDERCVFSAPR
ncbi:unannotated protein [freshwater metagenome]|uniref:Unannotated protein n=1 Tax=freshwater metagenome TaxID=449393 RepID=A0A6J6K202_9ZZZZ